MFAFYFFACYTKFMKIFVIEKSIESMFSAIFKSFYDKVIPDVVVDNQSIVTKLGDETFFVLNNKNLSDRVENALIKYGGFEILNDLKLAFCSSNKDILTIIFNYLYLLFYSKKDISKDTSSPFVCEFNYEVAKVKKEVFRAYANLKFQKNQDGIIYSVFSPTHDIIEVISPFFIKKLSGLPFIIQDKKRNKTIISDGKTIKKAVK